MLRTFCIALVWCLACVLVSAQGTVTIDAVVIDSATQAPLPFANAFNINRGAGTAANASGRLVLPANRVGDTLRVTYIGYTTKRLVIGADMPSQITLAPAATQLSEVVVVGGDSDFLFDLIRRVRRSRRTASYSAKTYFFLDSELDGVRAEVIEGYYNGRYANHKTVDLTYKKSRVGLQVVNGRVFTSTSSSRLFTISDLFTTSDLFPNNPLSLSRRRTREVFDLALASRYLEGDSEILVVDYTPRANVRQRFFSGTLWIDRTRGQLRKATLDIVDASVHPFAAMGSNTVERVDMHIERTFALREGDSVPEQTTVDYIITQSDTDGQYTTRTRTFTRPYDYESTFELPHFPTDLHRYQDYRDASIAPYDDTFWSETSEFRFYDALAEIEDFVRTQRPDTKSADRPCTRSAKAIDRRGGPHCLGHDARQLSGRPLRPIREQPRLARERQSTWYYFGGNLYLDLYKLPDGKLHYHTGAMLDPLNTSFERGVGPAQQAFYNTQFDMLELQRRELVTDLKRLPNLTYAAAALLYREHVAEFERNQRSSAQRMLLGYDLENLKRYTGILSNTIGIDNYQLFGVGEHLEEYELPEATRARGQ